MTRKGWSGGTGHPSTEAHHVRQCCSAPPRPPLVGCRHGSGALCRHTLVQATTRGCRCGSDCTAHSSGTLYCTLYRHTVLHTLQALCAAHSTGTLYCTLFRHTLLHTLQAHFTAHSTGTLLAHAVPGHHPGECRHGSGMRPPAHASSPAPCMCTHIQGLMVGKLTQFKVS